MSDLLRTIQANQEAAFGLAYFLVVMSIVVGFAAVHVVKAWRDR